MTKQNFDINKLRVAAPCSVGWETMTGDERVRRCHSCKLNIYNIAEMTNKEVENLITNREDRVCIRLYKRADGTVLTKDCPIGFRDYQKRVVRFAGATLAAILSLFSVSFGQDKKSVDASKVKIARVVNQNRENVLSGEITDRQGALIPGAELKLYRKGENNVFKVISDSYGSYIFRNIPAGKYILEAQASGFKIQKIVNLKIDGENLLINVKLEAMSVTVGIFFEEPLIDTTSSAITTKFTRKQIENLPY